MNLYEYFLEFYTNNKDRVDLVIVTALVTSLLTLFVTKVLPTVGSALARLSDKLVQKVGGQFAFRVIQRKYLNWVVLHNQDLNLTGTIGAGQKPRLEQIFISLKVTKGRLQEENEPTDSANTPELQTTLSIKRIVRDFGLNLKKNLLRFSRRNAKLERSKRVIFETERGWQFNKIYSRDYFFETFIFVFFMLLPISILIYQLRRENLGSTFLYIVLSFPVFVGVLRQRLKRDKYSIYLYAVPPIVLITTKILYLILSSSNYLYLVIGNVVGWILILIIFRDEIFTFKPPEENPAKEIGVLLSSLDNIAILGKPGSGKSTYAQYIALTFAQEKAGSKKQRHPGIVKRRFGIKEWYLPILIPLRKVSKFINPSVIRLDKNVCIEAFRQEVLPATVREIFSDSFVNFMLSKGRCILLLDGLDEVSNEEHFRLIVNDIQGLVSQYPKNKYLITSRHTGWRGGVGSAFQLAEVNDLDIDQISTFAYGWYESIELNKQNENNKMDDDERTFRKGRAQLKANQLIDGVNNNENIRNLARNPLLLSMICYVHYNKTLPKERLSLYEDCSRLLLEQWDIEKGLPQDDIPLKYAQKERIMQEIAFTLHNGKEHGGVRETTADEIIPVIERVLVGFNIEPDQAEVFFKKLVERTGLIISTEQYKNLYGFSHLTFQEFYTAKYLHRNGVAILAELDDKSPESQEKLSSWWREVIILQSGMMKDISEMIRSLCCNVANDYVGDRLQIASQCLADSAEFPDADTELILLDQLLRVRSLGEISVENHVITSMGKKYLLNFASNPRFQEFSLKTYARQIADSAEANEFAKVLFDLTKSVDRNVQYAAIDQFVELAEIYKDIDGFTQENISTFIKQVGVNARLLDILGLLEKFDEPLNKDLLIVISDICVKRLCDNVLLYYDEELNNSNTFCGLLKMVNEKSLVFDAEDLVQYICATLAKIFDSLPSYRNKHETFRLQLKNYLVCLIQFMLSICSPEEQEYFKVQLTNMVQKGTAVQCVWATMILGEIFPSDPLVRSILIANLHFPNNSVRLATIASLRRLSLSIDETTKLRKKYFSAISPKNPIKRVLSFGNETIFGVGDLGSTIAEKIQIAGSLLQMDSEIKLESLLPKYIWSSIYDHRYEWAEMLRDISVKLGSSDAEKISNELVQILSNSKNTVDFLDNFIVDGGKIHEIIRDKLVAHLYDDKRGGAIDYLYPFKPIVLAESKEFGVLQNALTNELRRDADAAFDILENNDLVRQAFFAN